MSSAAQGTSDVLGVLIDMAEVWELYVYSLLRTALLGADVQHTGVCNRYGRLVAQSNGAPTTSLGG